MRRRSSTANPKLLVLLNPGSTSRHYLHGLARAADHLGVLAGTIELEPIWRELRGAPASLPRITAGIQRQCVSRKATHVLGYAHNGVFDFGPFPDPLGRSDSPVGLFTALGLRHILLWTDHPNWAVGAGALAPQPAQTLAHPGLLHLVKSPAAADEVRDILGWADVRAIDMAEDVERIQPRPDVEPVHDVVTIMGDVAPVPARLQPLLEDENPGPGELMSEMLSEAAQRTRAMLASQDADDDDREAVELLADELCRLKLDRPLECFHGLALRIEHSHAAALRWLRADARRWFDLIGALQALTRWRRSFWTSWIGRRFDIGVYGSPAEPLGLRSPPCLEPDAHWIPYERQAEIYARGRVSLSINASHDEQGMSHKPFQIGAAGVACIHHSTPGLERAFDIGEQILEFRTAAELAGHIRQMIDHADARKRLGSAARQCVAQRHTWRHRLETILSMCRDAGAIDSPGSLVQSSA